MTVNYFRDFGEDYIIFSFTNDKLLKDIFDIRKNILETVAEFPYRKILIDISETDKVFFFLDWVKIIKVIHKEAKPLKIGLVDNKKEIPERNTIEAILFNSGIFFRTFNSLAEAKNWIEL